MTNTPNLPLIVSNMEVTDAHTDFAGALDVWAHNGLGTYFFKLRNGQFYSGKGDRSRCKTSMMQRMIETGSEVAWNLFWPAVSNEESFIMEDQLICDTGGLGSDTNHNTINSPGANLRNRRR